MRFDVHTHFFTTGMAGKGVDAFLSTLRLREMLDRIATVGDRTEADAHPVEAFLKNSTSEDGEATLSDLDNAAGEPMACCPLMLDVGYMEKILPSPGKGVARTRTRVAGTVADTLLGWKDAVASRRGGRADAAVETVSRWISEAEERFRTVQIGAVENDTGRAFDSQITTLTELKKRHSDRIFPFLGVDPRRNDALDGKLLSFIGDMVGKGRTFAGVKLYPPIGFSPTDPFLFGKGGFYEYAEKNGIPITVHFSAAGFAVMSDRVAAQGDIYDDDSGEIASVTDIFEDGVIDFHASIVNVGEAISERIRVFNHPKLWAKVLDVYPRLTLNLAHFGGFGRLHQYLDGRRAGHWSAFAREAIIKYPNVYADLSGWFEKREDTSIRHPLATFVADVYAKLPGNARSKVLYGSDWFILSLKDPDLGTYIKRFTAAFGKEWDAVSVKNPNAFLARTIEYK
ncbi:MAG: amidohydrolase family protein [Spirochaetota bacterium]